MRTLLMLLIFSSLIPSAIAIEIFEADKATIDLRISTDVEFVPQSAGARVESAEAKLSWVPRETYNQRVEKLNFLPEAMFSEVATFTLENPGIGTHELAAESIITTNNKIVPIREKPPFPVTVDAELSEYIQASEMIDLNSDINKLANSLAADKDDQYEVVFALADWVTTNIEYNLSTITADAVYPSSWVLEKGYGVCDEMTNLFISLNRALGIPARFVSGLAYTDLEGLPDWGGHGWAEVYFPGTGWVPFDPTYGEYGYLDSGHIKLKDSVGSNENSIEFSATGRGFSLKTEPLSFDVEVLGTTPRSFEFIEASIEPYADELRFGSYNILTLKVKNLRDYYVSTRIEVGETSELKYIGEKHRNILLLPREEKEYHFLVKVSESLDEDFIYTFPIAAFTKLSDPVETSFRATNDGTFYDENVFESLLEKEEFLEAAVDMNCDFESPVLETTTINCSFSGEGQGRICIDQDCERTSLPASLSAEFSRSPGIYTIPVRFVAEQEGKTAFITVQIVDETRLTITDVELPETITFEEQGALSFRISRLSESAATETDVIVRHKYFEKTWDETSGKYSLLFRGNQLHAGENSLEIIVNYRDALGNKKTTSEEITIQLVDLSLIQRINLWLRALEHLILQ